MQQLALVKSKKREIFSLINVKIQHNVTCNSYLSLFALCREIAYAKLCKNISLNTTSDHRLVVNTSRMEITTSHVEIYTILREV